jgi:hypothetical protein
MAAILLIILIPLKLLNYIHCSWWLIIGAAILVAAFSGYLIKIDIKK